MSTALLTLIGFQLAGELVREALRVPIPGPVIGMFVLTAILAWRARRRSGAGASKPLEDAAEALIGSMGLLFVPAGVGVITEVDLLRREWLPIVAGVVGSTILSLAVTGLVMHWTLRRANGLKASPAPILDPAE